MVYNTLIMRRAKLTIYYGPMFSGKSALLIKDILQNIDIAKLVFKPKGDVRSEKLYTREGLEFEAIGIETPKEILERVEDWVETIYIDEINFFDSSLTDVIKEILSMGISVVVSGLDKDYRTEYFPNVKNLIELSDKSVGLKASCHICGNPSAYTARFIDGKPDSKDSKTIISDKFKDNVEYKTVCAKCHPFLGE